MLTTQDAALAERLRMIRAHGSRKRYYHEIIGGNFRLDALQAAILRIKLRRLDDWTEARRRNAARYNALLAQAGVPLEGPADWPEFEKGRQVVLPKESPCAGKAAVRREGDPFPGHRHVYNQYVIRVGRREAVIAALKAAGIGHEVYYPVPLHRQECFAALKYAEGSLPVSECAARTTLALPVYPELTLAQQEEVVAALVKGLRS
jgi:dTDP-4-amino-4,6-dideoxygalactose transaminase